MTGLGRRLVGLLATAAVIGAGCGNFHSREEIRAAAVGAGTDALARGASGSSTGQTRTTRAGANDSVEAGGGAVARTGDHPGGEAVASPESGAATPGAGSGARSEDQRTASGPAAPVRIGHIGTYSGIVGFAFRNGLPMIQASIRWLNDNGGLNGHPIELITADDRGDPARANSLARRMVEEDGVIAFTNFLLPLSSGGPAPYVNEKRVPVIGGESLSSTWFENPMYFPQTGLHLSPAFGAIRGFVQVHGARKIAILYCSESTACSEPNAALTGAKVKELGGEVVYRAQVSLAQPDFTSECLQASNSGAEAILALVDSASFPRIARSCRQQNFTPKYGGISLGLTNQLEGDPNFEGLIGPTLVFPWRATDTDNARLFHRVIEQYGPDNLEPDSVSSQVWAGTVLLREVGKNLPADPTSDDMLAGLYGISNNDLGKLTPPLTFREGELPVRQLCYFLGVIVDGRWSAPNGSNVTCL